MSGVSALGRRRLHQHPEQRGGGPPEFVLASVGLTTPQIGGSRSIQVDMAVRRPDQTAGPFLPLFLPGPSAGERAPRPRRRELTEPPAPARRVQISGSAARTSRRAGSPPARPRHSLLPPGRRALPR